MFLIRKREVIIEPECMAVALTRVTSFVEKDEYTYQETNSSKLNHRTHDEVFGMGICLYDGWTAVSLCHMWCDAFQPFDEAIYNPETPQFTP
jgi:hypothetical protein